MLTALQAIHQRIMYAAFNDTRYGKQNYARQLFNFIDQENKFPSIYSVPPAR